MICKICKKELSDKKVFRKDFFCSVCKKIVNQINSCPHHFERICELCGKTLTEEHFTRISAESGIKEKGFLYCNSCVRGKMKAKNRLLDKYSRGVSL